MRLRTGFEGVVAFALIIGMGAPRSHAGSSPAPAKASFELRTARVRIAVPSGWKALKDLYGLPLSILSPDYSGGTPEWVEDNEARRTLLSVIPTGARKVELVAEGLKRGEADYFASKQEDLQSLGARLVEKFPYRYEALTGASLPNLPRGIHRIGVKYATEKYTFVELSHYLVCNSEIFLLKALIHQEDLAKDAPRVDQAVRSFECR